MTKQELVNAVATETNSTNVKVEAFVRSLTNLISANMVRGEKTSITGFGTFDLGKRAGRKGVNPQTHEPIEIPAMNMPRFRAGNRLLKAVRAK